MAMTPGTTNRTPATMPPTRPVQQPADIDRELLRLRPGQQHAVVQRMQEPALRDPVLLLDEDAVHDRDLAGRAAEAEQGDPQPDAQRFAEADAVIGCRLAPASIVFSIVASITASPCWWASCASRLSRVAAPAVERVVQRHAGLELFEIVVEHARQAERSGEQSGRFRRQIGPSGVGAAHHRGQPQQAAAWRGRTPRS